MDERREKERRKTERRESERRAQPRRLDDEQVIDDQAQEATRLELLEYLQQKDVTEIVEKVSTRKL